MSEWRRASEQERLETIRHSTAHLLAQAVLSIYPSVKVAIGPVIEDGFYYDFAFERAFTPEDLVVFEEKMRACIQENHPIQRLEWSRQEALAFCQAAEQPYKVEIINAIPPTETLSFYQQGQFTDLCRGPHVASTGELGVFKLLRVAGAHWRGDSKAPMLTRIYGTAWETEEQLKQYLVRIEEAEKRDHRKWAKKLDLFHWQEEAPGMIFWHQKGWTIYKVIMDYMSELWRCYDYQEVRTPQVLDRRLWEQSGHWDLFRQNMFGVQTDDRQYALKPMNCPAHIQIFNQQLQSYRALPLRLAEFGCCHRNEVSGSLHGAMRCRQFVQDDAHIFCTEAQIQSEVRTFVDILYRVYADFGFHTVIVRLATRPEARVGSEAHWDQAEKALADALDSLSIPYVLSAGEGAFYGPKLEFSLKDSIGRVWQCGTIQVDFSMPGRLGASYIAEDGKAAAPVLLHRAIFGSLERFIAILIEEHAGSLPVWLSPVQAVILTLTDRQSEYARRIKEAALLMGLRVELDERHEKIGLKIREHTMQRVPYLWIVGDKEQSAGTIAVRTREGQEIKDQLWSELLSSLKKEGHKAFSGVKLKSRED